MSNDAPAPFPFRLDFPVELPISARAEEIVAAIQQNQVVVLAGETGSGKTTQIPKMCLAAGRGTKGRIACTQPRRVAALSISRRVAEELGVDWGREVGCKIRFSDQTSNSTIIKFMTDGMLLAEVQGDPMLRDYDTVILDEAHERSLNIDFLLGHLRLLRHKRPELKIIITSATIDTEMFSKAFDEAPVIEVSGRTYPVEVVYAPLDELGSDAAEDDEKDAKAEAMHYIDGAVEAVERIIRESDRGDVLVFMPAERDIRETTDLLEGRGKGGGARLGGCEIVPLFGRLSNAEQQRVFAPTQKRKIVISTNIAETSLTIPGIRFVVDTGMARVSRYAAQARTRRLPIEEIAQSSADQRKGRCGRVSEGVCIRLYSEKDFEERPRFAQPEIQRANLADVILRMKAFGLGDIERFPFINMPATKSIRAGYALLDELGAIAESRGGGVLGGDDPASYVKQLTQIGRELARLPVDPTVGRMILQARKEKCVREVAVIAAGLSIQDPRERPMEKQAQADAAHRKFAHPDSDFLTLLNIWDTFHDEFETMSQSRLRRFCRDHFLSYTRMREWRDIHEQLIDVMRERNDFARRPSSVEDGLDKAKIAKEGVKMDFGTPAYRAIHRSVLAGLLGNIAARDDEGGGYKATHDRRVSLFPGSVLFKRDEPQRRGGDGARAKPEKKAGQIPRWIMTAEIMETSRLYARTCARLDPLWALELGSHLLKVSHSEPFWDVEKGRVLVKQRTRLYGLELETRSVGYGKINPAHATEIFIREALVNDTITWPFDFLANNRAVREKTESLLTRMRDNRYMNLDEGIYRFYATRLGVENMRGALPDREDNPGEADDSRPLAVSAVGDLVALVRERKPHEPDFLMMEIEDLRDPEELDDNAEAFPESVPLENRALPLTYAYKPGQVDDGVTIEVSVREAEQLTAAALDWAIPGHLAEKVEHYLRAAPKELRRAFMPLAETAKSLAEQVASRDRLTGRRETLVESLAAQIEERFRVRIDAKAWAEKAPLPDFLRVRVRVMDDEGTELCASRDLAEIHAAVDARERQASMAVSREDPAAWKRARARWETKAAQEWIFGNIPASVEIGELAGVRVEAFPGLKITQGDAGPTNVRGGPKKLPPSNKPIVLPGVALRLFRTPEEAVAETRLGLERLLEYFLKYELAWMEKDLSKGMREIAALAAAFLPVNQLQTDAYEMMRRWVCDAGRISGELSAEAFKVTAERAKMDLRGIVPKVVDLVREILTARLSLQVLPGAYPSLARDVAALVPQDFMRMTPWPRLAHFPRYLKAMRLRAERWKQNPVKDAERAKTLAPYEKAVAGHAADGSSEAQAFRWLVEEFRVSLYAQELGTAEPVSVVKLDKALLGLRGVEKPHGVNTAPAAKTAPVMVRPVTVKSQPLKGFGGLDSLFKK